jgi:hypothetical protein
MPRAVSPGATDQTEYFYITEDVGGTNPGEPKTGLTHTNLTSAYYVRTRGAAVQIASLSTLADPDSAHTDAGFKEVSSANLPGVYRFDPPDAAYATGADEVIIHLLVAGASNAIARPVKVILGPPADVTQVNGTNVTTVGEIAADVTKWNGTAVGTPHTAGYPVVTVKDGTGTGEIDTNTGGVKMMTGGIISMSFAAGAIDAAATSADFVTEIRDSVRDLFSLSGNVNDASPAAGNFDGNSGLSATDDFYNGSVLVFTSGTLDGIARKITDYTGATRNLVFATAFPSAPANADTFLILGRID